CTHDHHHHHHHQDPDLTRANQRRPEFLPEEIAEEEDLKMMMSSSSAYEHHRHEGYTELSGLGLWIHALACSLLVSLASLICLILLPVIFARGKPSRAGVDALALFGAGAMLGDAFLHQLPHAFGGGSSHSHEHDHHDADSGPSSHSHSIAELSVGLSILAGIVVFLIVEKLVRYVDDSFPSSGHNHHHHNKHLRVEKEGSEEQPSDNSAEPVISSGTSGNNGLRKVRTSSSEPPDLKNGRDGEQRKPQSNLVFGYLNLFSDGVHNFTDGMALGTAFLLYGSLGGWSRTLFLLAHELPQEIGDFGILVRSGFSVSKALFYNFLSALVALAGTAVALIWGKDHPGQSSLIEGFTAGGFIYISLAGVLAEMNNNGVLTVRSTVLQLFSFLLGMAVALSISLVE
ncbi:hypothetical protein M569_03886, partial [Genlisea aurea]